MISYMQDNQNSAAITGTFHFATAPIFLFSKYQQLLHWHKAAEAQS
jgi:hypothetical protein